MISLIVQFTKSFDFTVLYPMIEVMGFTTEAIKATNIEFSSLSFICFFA